MNIGNVSINICIHLLCHDSSEFLVINTSTIKTNTNKNYVASSNPPNVDCFAPNSLRWNAKKLLLTNHDKLFQNIIFFHKERNIISSNFLFKMKCNKDLRAAVFLMWICFTIHLRPAFEIATLISNAMVARKLYKINFKQLKSLQVMMY